MNSLRNDEILEELRRITKLLALIVTKDQIQKNQIETLNKIGFPPKEIANMLGTTQNTVNVALHSIRKKTSQKKKVRAKEKKDGNK